eukprot:gene15321-20647_t
MSDPDNLNHFLSDDDNLNAIVADHFSQIKNIDENVGNELLQNKRHFGFTTINFVKYIDIVIPLLLFCSLATTLVSSESYGYRFCNHKIAVETSTRIIEMCCLFTFGAKLISLAINSYDIFQEQKNSRLKLHLALMIICLISGASIGYHWYLSSKHDHICIDGFGVPYFTIHLAEWFSVVPFLVYISCSIFNPRLGLNDIVATISSMLMILFGFCLALSKSFWMSVVFYLLSICGFLINFRYLTVSINHSETSEIDEEERLLNDKVVSTVKKLRQDCRKSRGYILAAMFCVFPLVHALGWSHILSTTQVLEAFIFCSTFVKIILCETFSQSHIFLSVNINKIITVGMVNIIKKQTERQNEEITVLNEFRVMLGNVTHDLKTPLAGFSGAIDLIQQDLHNSSNILNEVIPQINSFEDKNVTKFSKLLEPILHHFSAVDEYISDMKPFNQSLNLFSIKSDKCDSIRFSIDTDNTVVQFPSPVNQNDPYNVFSLYSALTSMHGNVVAPDITPKVPTISTKDVVESFLVDSPRDADYSIQMISTNQVDDDIMTHQTSAKRCLNILLTDDSEMILKVVSRKLIRAGHTVDLAENGAVAVNKIINNHFGDGWNTNIDSSRKHIAGMDYLLEKPFDLDKFNQALEILKLRNCE